MPLNPAFKKVERNMEAEYGKKKGKQIAYAWANKHHFKTD
jgi:hypothetical protein